jgi:hypothetical protein
MASSRAMATADAAAMTAAGLSSGPSVVEETAAQGVATATAIAAAKVARRFISCDSVWPRKRMETGESSEFRHGHKGLHAFVKHFCDGVALLATGCILWTTDKVNAGRQPYSGTMQRESATSVAMGGTPLDRILGGTWP